MRIDPRTSLSTRLLLVFGLLLGLLLAAVMTVVLVWFYYFERGELLDNVETEAAMVATQSKAAVMFADRKVLQENLAVLRHESAVVWAVIGNDEGVLASYGEPPPDLAQIRLQLGAAGNRIEMPHQIILRQEIRQGNYLAGDLMIAVDLAENQSQLVHALMIAIGAMLLAMLFGLPLLRRLTRSITGPLVELLVLAQRIAFQGDDGSRAEALGADEIGRLADSFNQMLNTLRLRNLELSFSRDELRELNQRLETVREDERTRLAREVHDELGQQLTALKLEVARVMSEEGRLADADWTAVSAMFDRAVRTVREIAWELRPSVLDTLGLCAAIEWLGQDFQRRMATRCRTSLPEYMPEVSAEVATHLFRICQELLTNVMRHADASCIDVVLQVDESIVLEVTDNGVGMPMTIADGHSLGLLGIRERVRRIGGRMRIETIPAIQGTRVRIEVPYAKEANHSLGEGEASSTS